MKIVQGGYKIWQKLVIGRFFLLPATFLARNFCQTEKVTFFGYGWLTPPFNFSKNDVIPKVACALFEVRVRVFGMGTGFSISCLVIAKIAFFAKKSMSKMVRNFCFQKYWLFKEEKTRKFLNVLGVNCDAQCRSSCL